MISGSNKSLSFKTLGSTAIKGLVVVAGLMLSLAPAQAQGTHRNRHETNANRQLRIARTIKDTYTRRWEAAAGGGFLRFRSGEYLQQNDEVTFFGTAQYSLNPKLGVLGEIAGAYGNAKIGTNPYLNSLDHGGFKPQISEYTFTAGPSYRLRAQEKYAVTAFATGGVALGKFDSGSHGFTSSNLGVWQSGYDPVVTAGFNLDYNFYPNLAFRVTPKFVGTFFDDKIQTNRGFNLGLVYRFGRIK